MLLRSAGRHGSGERDDTRDYIAKLKAHPAEITLLFRDLLIRVTIGMPDFDRLRGGRKHSPRRLGKGHHPHWMEAERHPAMRFLRLVRGWRHHGSASSITNTSPAAADG